MLKLFLPVVTLCATISSSYAGGLPSRGIHGNYIEARTADVYTGPCFANGEVGLVGKLAVFGWKITDGTWHGVDLSGLSIVGVVQAHHTLGDAYETSYPVRSILIIDSHANPEQRLALQSLAHRMSGDLLQDVVKVDYQPIDLEVKGGNIHSASATLTAGSIARIETRAMNDGDHICSNEEVWYPPLNKLDHAMPAYALDHSYSGTGLNETWSSPYKRSGFVGTFSVPAE